MMEVEVCPECGVPVPFNQGQAWLNNGDIVQRLNPRARLGFIECENLDPLFENIGNIIGVSIEHLIVNITARAIELYMQTLIPEQIRGMVIARELDPVVFAETIMTYCHIVGFGKYENLDQRYEQDEDDYAIYRVTKPFSVPLAAGALAGALSALVGGNHAITYEETSPGVYTFKTKWTEYEEQLAERLPLRLYDHMDGDLELERCSTCGTPAAFRGYKWLLDEGIIINGHTGRRMTLVGPETLDHVYAALEAELGETIPEVVVEAQRLFTKTGFYSIEQVSDEGDFRTQLALRGLGNLREMEMGSKGLVLRIDNAAGYLMTVGMVQGLFEMAFDVDSTVRWTISPERNLDVQITPL